MNYFKQKSINPLPPIEWNPTKWRQPPQTRQREHYQVHPERVPVEVEVVPEMVVK